MHSLGQWSGSNNSTCEVICVIFYSAAHTFVTGDSPKKHNTHNTDAFSSSNIIRQYRKQNGKMIYGFNRIIRSLSNNNECYISLLLWLFKGNWDYNHKLHNVHVFS